MSYSEEWIWAPALIAVVLLFLLIPPFAMLGLAVVLLFAVATLVALVGAIVATPFLLVRAARRRWHSRSALPVYTAQAIARRAQ